MTDDSSAASGPPEPTLPTNTDNSASRTPAADHPIGHIPGESPTHASGDPRLQHYQGEPTPKAAETSHCQIHQPNPSESPVRAPGGPPDSTLPASTDRKGRLGRVVHRPADNSRLGRLIDRLQPPREGDFRGPAHHEKVTARLGVWLGVAFLLCFATGLLSHAIQKPPSWFVWPADPVQLYRITQGVHVLSGIAAIPLLLAKLWSVFPKLFARPIVRSLPHALERLSILVLSGAAFFELTTGLFNATQNYPWSFYFLAAHYAVAWLAVGSILLHVAVKLPVIRRALNTAPDLSRRAFLRTTYLTAGAAVIATAGATVPLLRDVSPLSWRSDRGPQGLPVNRTARAAGVTRDPTWQLVITSGDGTVRLSLADLEALPQRTADLPIACVEGWSQNATWTGVPIADLMRLAGADPNHPVRVTSLERKGAYRTSVLPATHTRSTLLALRLNGEQLAIDHGFPCRVIAPNRPGVLQTKWVNRLEIL